MNLIGKYREFFRRRRDKKKFKALKKNAHAYARIYKTLSNKAAL